MAGRLSTTSNAVMALLSFAPMSGYQLARAVDRSVSRFWPISKPQVYSELRRLESLGFVEGSHVAQDGLPDKRVFTLTPAGERALDAWLQDDHLDASRFRIPVLVKLLVAHRVGAHEARRWLRAYGAAAEEQRRALQELHDALADTPDAAYARATVLYGLKVSRAVAEWAEEVEHSLPAAEIRIDPRRRRAENALRLLGALPSRAGRSGR